MREFSVGDIRKNIADVLDAAAKDPVRVLTLRAMNGVRREPVVIMSETHYKKLTRTRKVGS